MATVSVVVYNHHRKNDGTFNVKIRIYHKKQKKLIDTTHCVSEKQIHNNFKNWDKFLIKILKKQ
jgi:hypothetical protein